MHWAMIISGIFNLFIINYRESLQISDTQLVSIIARRKKQREVAIEREKDPYHGHTPKSLGKVDYLRQLRAKRRASDPVCATKNLFRSVELPPTSLHGGFWTSQLFSMMTRQRLYFPKSINLITWLAARKRGSEMGLTARRTALTTRRDTPFKTSQTRSTITISSQSKPN
jgi:hypothetical protein